MTGSSDGEVTTEDVIRVAIARGLRLEDFEQMELGMIIDYLVTCQNAEYDAKHPQRAATQADIDAF